jgi:hypothetical protein
MIGIIFSYVVGVNIYIILALMLKGIKIAIKMLYKFCAKTLRFKLMNTKLKV